MTETALILHLQRLSTEDGPGIRTTVFFKGCPLRCEWCHNPESLSRYPQVQRIENRCLLCQTCLAACPLGALALEGDQIFIDRQACDGCGLCAEECPSGAMEALGRRISADELFYELLKDRVYFEKSGGGVTLSGGEPTLQAGFAADLMQRLQAEGISTALDTCGLCPTEALEEAVENADLILFDLKEIDPQRHAAFTGASNQKILANLQLTGDLISHSERNQRLWIRTPLIPGATATEQNLLGLGAFIAEHLQGLVERWELCAFNNLCRDKYRRLGLSWRYVETPLLTAGELAEFEAIARSSGVDPQIVIATGAVAVKR